MSDIATGLGVRCKMSCVRLGGDASAPPLYLVPGLGGQAMPFLTLARELADVCSLHCFQLDPVRTEASVAAEETLVARYVQQLHASGRGPFRLAGYCAGAAVACAVASHLREDEVTGSVLAIVQVADGSGAADQLALVDLAECMAAVRQRFANGGYEGLEEMDRSLLQEVGISPDVLPRYAMGILDIMVAQSRAIAHQCVPVTAPVKLVIGAANSIDAEAARSHWRAFLAAEPAVRLLTGPWVEGWLRHPMVGRLSAAIVADLDP